MAKKILSFKADKHSDVRNSAIKSNFDADLINIH